MKELPEGRGINRHYIHDVSTKVLKTVKPLIYKFR